MKIWEDKKITTIKDINDHWWTRNDFKPAHPGSTRYCDGFYYFHWHIGSNWKVKEYSYDYGLTWHKLSH